MTDIFRFLQFNVVCLSQFVNICSPSLRNEIAYEIPPAQTFAHTVGAGLVTGHHWGVANSFGDSATSDGMSFGSFLWYPFQSNKATAFIFCGKIRNSHVTVEHQVAWGMETLRNGFPVSRYSIKIVRNRRLQESGIKHVLARGVVVGVVRLGPKLRSKSPTLVRLITYIYV
jgi:hypothetical protein